MKYKAIAIVGVWIGSAILGFNIGIFSIAIAILACIATYVICTYWK